jgi:ABC-2 type transport system ATP-binding protein
VGDRSEGAAWGPPSGSLPGTTARRRARRRPGHDAIPFPGGSSPPRAADRDAVGVIVLDGLTKKFGSHVAVDALTAAVRPGRVTGLLGPDGSGRTTILRCILGLTRPTSGTAVVLGQRYRQLPRPLRQVGALVGDGVGRPNRTAYAHLRALAQANGLPRRRVDEVIELVGLGSVAHERVRTLPYAGGRRLGLAVALLGDPDVLLLDEPLTGLGPGGVRMVRELLRGFADEGRTVLVSGHPSSGLEETADHLVVLDRGRLLADVPVGDLLGTGAAIRVRSPRAPLLATAIRDAGGGVVLEVDGALRVEGMEAAEVGDVAFSADVPLHELAVVPLTLAEAYLRLADETGGTSE